MSTAMSSQAMSSKAKFRSHYQAPAFTIDHIDLSIRLAPARSLVTSKLQYRRLHDQAESLTLDGEHLELLSVALNGEPLTGSQWQQTEQGLVIHGLPSAGELTIENIINPKANTRLEGLYLSDGAYCTQCEAEGFRHITYFIDRPDVLSTYTVRVEGPTAMRYLLSNGNKVAHGQLDDDWHFATWHDPHPKPCYLFALVAGNFDCLADTFVTQQGREVALEVYVDQGNLLKAEHALRSLQKAMAWDEQRYGLCYDLDVYMVVAVDFFNMGAMENKGLNIFNSKYVLADKATATDVDYHNIESIIGHEYFHNWTGNRVTCRDWFQLSLKEGLTVFRDQQFSADMASTAAHRINEVKVLRGHQFAEDAGPMAHPIRPERVEEMNNFYTMTVYNKGAEVIRMQHTLLGEAGFRKGMDLYFARHDGQAVTCDDFVQAMQDANATDLSQFRRWYSQSGTPQVRANWHSEQSQWRLELSQHTAATHDQVEKLPLVLPLRYQWLSLQYGPLTDPLLLVLNTAQQQETFTGLTDDAFVVLNLNFSAPIQLHIDYSLAQLQCIIAHCTDAFSRWDALQQLWLLAVKQLLSSSQTLSATSLPSQGAECDAVATLLATIGQLLKSEEQDSLFYAELLAVPTADLLLSHFEPIPIIALQQTLLTLQQRLLTEFEQHWLALYQRFAGQDDSGARAVVRQALLILAPRHSALLLNHYQAADNMTDQMAAFAASRLADEAVFREIASQFEQTFNTQSTVMDKWLMMLASFPGTSAAKWLATALAHPVFSWQNPNRVRAVFGSYCQSNVLNFHAADGSGYQQLAHVLTKVDDINPQTASRLVTPLLAFARFAEPQRTLMHHQLQELLKKPNLSADLAEKLHKALA